MTKNRYKVTGVDSKGERFYGTGLAYDIVSVIQLFRDNEYSVHTVQSREQAHADDEIRIEDVQYCRNNGFTIDSLNKKEKLTPGRDCCQGDEALYRADDENNAFVDSRGNMLTTIKGMSMRYKVKCCPNCGEELWHG